MGHNQLEEQIGQLRELGLNTYEARAYLTLLGKDSFTASQLADYSGVPRQRIYDILSSLVERGLVISQPSGRGTRYIATAPTPALQALLHREQERLGRIQAVTGRLIEQLNQVYREGQEETSPLECIQVLRGPAAISQRLEEIVKGSKREILAFSKPPYAKSIEETLVAFGSLRNKVAVRSLYEDSALSDPATRPAILAFIQQGEQARFIQELPLKLVIVDECIALFTLEAELAGRTNLTVMLVENAQLARTLKLSFETLWSRAEPLAAACQRLQIPYEADAPQTR